MSHTRLLRDTAIRDAVMERLALLPCLDLRELQVHARRGRVTLIGWVSDEALIPELVREAKATPNVSEVICKLGVSPRPSFRSDEEVAAHVLSGISQDADIDTRQIRLSVHSGDVLLTGWVADREQAKNAEANAWWTAGVLNVINHLQVGSEPVTAEGLGDRAIAEALLNRLIHSPRLETRDLAIAVDDGVVTVYGSLPDSEQVQAVLEIAESMPGVSRVENRLALCERPQV